MKTRIMTMASATAFTLLIACGILTGCADKDVYNPNAGKPELKPEEDYFDFITTGNVDFDVNYGKMAGGALLEVYTELPVVYKEDGTYSMKGEANYKIFTDENGCFKGKVDQLPAGTTKVYIYSANWGAPMLVKADVVNGKVIVDTTEEETSTRTEIMTRANRTLKIIDVNSTSKIYSIVNWGQYGRIDDINQIKSDGIIESNVISQLQKKLWQGASSKPYNLDNKGLVRDTKHVNTSIAKAYKNDKGQTVNVVDAELYLTFLTERAGYQSTIGYYYYKTGEAPRDPDELKKYIVVPNASIEYDDPFNGAPYKKKDAPIKKNTKIQLLYEDEIGNISNKFPAGYTIGYFIISDAFKPAKNNSDKGTITTSKNFIYSDKEWNNFYEGNQERFISLSAKNTLIYGVEDGADSSYEDVLFSIDCNPNEAIQDPDRPVIDPEQPEITATETTYRTYAYEDIWPNGGDYDLNDVIIEHKQEIFFTNIKNQVTKVIDTFTPVQRNNAATFESAFAVQYANDQRGTIVLPSESIDETETSSVIVFTNTKTAQGRSLQVIRTFKNSLVKSDLITDLNPFIITKYVAGANSRIEVHLPKATATSKANKELFGAEADAYYIDKSGKYPFAIMIPRKSSFGAEGAFIPASEKVSINKEYPDYDAWVQSNGSTHADWYTNYKPIQ